MDINIASITYSVELITESGTRYLINEALVELQWEEQISELAQRATIKVSNMKIGNTFLMDIAKINCLIFIYADWGAGKTQVFDGTIWEWEYASATQKELTITAYDQMIRLQQSKDFKYFSAGMTTPNIISNICADWGITFSYQWARQITHEKKTFSGNSISDMIISLLEEVKQKSGEKYIAYFKDGTFVVTGYGTNTDVYRFDFLNTVSTDDKLTINNLVTRVKIIGKEDKSGRAPVEDTLIGDTRFGVLQEIVRRDDNKKLSDVRSDAQTILKERGKPEETIQVEGPDVPFLRKGYKIEMGAGNLLGFFYLEGVTHTAQSREMTMTLSRTA